ncbi:hypothetical protein Tco_1568140 [Tanacetum coccineum]
MMKEWMAGQTEANERMKTRNKNDKGDVEFIEEDETQPILTMLNPNPIMSNSPTLSSFLKDCTVHIPYKNKKTFADDVLPNYVGGEEFNKFDDIGTERMTKKEIKQNDKGMPKEPNKEFNWNGKVDHLGESAY